MRGQNLIRVWDSGHNSSGLPPVAAQSGTLARPSLRLPAAFPALPCTAGVASRWWALPFPGTGACLSCTTGLFPPRELWGEGGEWPLRKVQRGHLSSLAAAGQDGSPHLQEFPGLCSPRAPSFQGRETTIPLSPPPHFCTWGRARGARAGQASHTPPLTGGCHQGCQGILGPPSLPLLPELCLLPPPPHRTAPGLLEPSGPCRDQ